LAKKASILCHASLATPLEGEEDESHGAMVTKGTVSISQTILFGVGALPYAFLTTQKTWRDHGGELAALAGVKPGDHVLDLGCGPGESAFGMVERIPGLRVTGLDLSAPMIRFAQLRRKIDGVEFVQGDAMQLPFPDGSFDAVTGHSFLYLVPDAVKVLSEVRRVLKPGKRCVFLEPANVPDRPLLPAEIRARTLRSPRFVASMALWRIVSRRYGRFDDARFARSFGEAGLRHEETRPTLGGIGLFGVGVRALHAPS
jgi:ubiquinone/menaquinone biosynthesis C-methylase UbiE